MQNYSNPRSRKSIRQVHQSTMRGGKLMPVSVVPFLPSEGGILNQEISVEMEPVAGRLISDILLEVVSVSVPILACDEVYNSVPGEAGNTEIFRKRLLDGAALFPLEGESDISMRTGVEPISVNGELLTNSVTRIAHNVAVNFLRRRKYHAAAQVDVTNDAVTPALLSTTILDRFNAVLSPEDRINGAVALEGEVPVRGIGLYGSAMVGDNPSPLASRQSHPEADTTTTVGWLEDQTTDGGANNKVRLVIEQDPDRPGHPNIRADFGLASGQSLSLKQFYLAQRQDELIRGFQEIIERNPEHGPGMIARMVHGLEIDTGKMPFVLYQQTVALGAGIRSAMDGPSLDVVQTNTAATVRFSRLVPKNEFGSIVLTFISVKPEEVVAGQPHPVLSHPWEVVNFAADDLRIDPEPVTRRMLDSATPQVNEADVMFWVGPNHFERSYDRYDWSRDVDVGTVEHKSARWRYAVPIGVDPENIIYPEDIDHYPFVLNAPTDPACSYVVKLSADIASPVKLGPTPVENLDIIETDDIFEEEV